MKMKKLKRRANIGAPVQSDACGQMIDSQLSPAMILHSSSLLL